MGRLLSRADGRKDGSDIAVEHGSSDERRLKSKAITPDEFASTILVAIISDSNAFEDGVETAMSETPDDPARVANQIRSYLLGFHDAAKAAAVAAIARKDEEED